MRDNRFAPTPHFAIASEDGAVAGGEGIGSGPPEVRNDVPRDVPAAGAGRGMPSGTRMDATNAAQPRAKNTSPPPRNVTPAPEPAAKAFPESWREDLAGGDKAFRKTLDRFESPVALAKAYKELTARLSSGDLRSTKPPADDATPAQLAAWRAEHGLPTNAAAYVDGLQLGDGTVTGEAERALLASFADQALKGRWTATQYNQAVGWYFDMQDRLAAQRDHADAAFKHEGSKDLMREWGHDYETNRNTVAQFFDQSFPEDFKDALLTARLSDGRVLANHPTFNKAILEVAKSLNPSGAMLPNTSGGGLSNVESRIAEIESKYMRAPHGSDLWKSYWTGNSGARMQQEYRGLLARREQARVGRAG
ncbi:MAG TPA: hypothetical protein VKP67_16235 [Xanthobacteraceae bacterium]|nr:hypothetical protein [Xanthobacteraceae bacterium]